MSNVNVLDYSLKYKRMRNIGKLTAECLNLLEDYITPGQTTNDINQYVKTFTDNYHTNLVNAQYHYVMNESIQAFPGYCCTSVNEVMCHGIPSVDNILKEGDLVKVDVTFIKDGYHGDSCRSYVVGKGYFPRAERIRNVAEQALYIGIDQAKPGNQIGRIGEAIEDFVSDKKMSVSKDFIGHGIGLKFHDFPQVFHGYETAEQRKLILEPGMTFTIEPIICEGKPNYRTSKDGWGVKTKDKKWSAQFEHTLGITETGNEIFTQ